MIKLLGEGVFMRKILSLSILMIMFVMLGAIDVSAQSASTRLTTASTSVRHGQTTDILVRIDASDPIRGGQFYTSLSNNNFEIVSVSGQSGLSVDSSDSYHLAYRMEAGFSISSGSAIAQVRVRPASNASVGASSTLNVSDVGVTLEGHSDTVSAGSDSINLTVAETPEPRSGNNYLESLSSPVVDLDFDRNQQEYNVTVPNDVTSLDLSASVEHEDASYEIIGDEDFVTGENHVRVVVTAENGQERTYSIYVDREKSDNNLLSSLKIADYEIDFDPNTFEYQVDVTDPGVSELDIAYETEDENASVEVIGNEDLQVGRNIIRMIVTAENGETQHYTLTVNVLDGEVEVTQEEGINTIIIVLSVFLVLVIAAQIYFLLKWRRENKV